MNITATHNSSDSFVFSVKYFPGIEIVANNSQNLVIRWRPTTIQKVRRKSFRQTVSLYNGDILMNIFLFDFILILYICPSVCLSVCLYVFLPSCPSVYFSVCLSLCLLSTCPSVCLPVGLFVLLSVYFLSTCLSVYSSVYLSVSVSVGLSVYLSVCSLFLSAYLPICYA